MPRHRHTDYLNDAPEPKLEAELRRDFLEAYASRRPSQSIRQVAHKLDIREAELLRWLRDPAFRDELRDQDMPRLFMAREVAMRHIGAVVEAQAKLATGPTKAGSRAAEFLAKICGLTGPDTAITVNNNVSTEARVDARDVATILREMREVDALLEEQQGRDH